LAAPIGSCGGPTQAIGHRMTTFGAPIAA